MKPKATLLTLATIAILCLATATATAGEGEGEDAYHNCAICQPIIDNPEMMQHVRWDSEKIATGMISVTSVDAEYAEAFDQAHDKMMKAVEKLESSEDVELCPFCTRMSALAEAGATIENVKTGGQHIMVVTAQQPAVIEKIHAHQQWAQQEFGAQHDHAHGG